MGKTLYLLSNGELKRKDNTLFIARENENPKFLPVETLDVYKRQRTDNYHKLSTYNE